MLPSRRRRNQQRPFEPVSGQAGKDVVWVPSPPDMVNKMMEMAKVTPNDFVIDLGSGDGRNIIAAAKLGARAVGVEFNPDMVALSRRLKPRRPASPTRRSSSRRHVRRDISKATVLALFLLPVNMNKLAPKFFDLRRARALSATPLASTGGSPTIASCWMTTPTATSWCEALLWIVPAKVAGTWTMANGTMTITQEYQVIKGTVVVDGSTYTIPNTALRGADIKFIAGGLNFIGKVSGNEITGTITTPAGKSVEGRAN